MTIIEIVALSNGAHRNQSYHGVLPEGWAIKPDDMVCENFPFGEVEVSEVNGVMTVTKWTPGEIPVEEPEEPGEPKPTLDERVTTLEESNAEMTEALDLLLSGVTE